MMVSTAMAGCSSAESPRDARAPGAGGGELAVTVASYDIAAGDAARLLVGVEGPDRLLVAFGSLSLDFAFAGTGQGGPLEPGPQATAAYLPIPGTVVPEPPPDAPRLVSAAETRGVYSAQVGFDRAGFWQVTVTAEIDGQPLRGTGAFQVGADHQYPAVGQAALPTANLTLESADAPPGAIDSRAAGGAEVPDPELHRTTIAASLASGRPVVAVFATPVYCRSRFCGPVVDAVAELEARYRDRADFVHVEIWRDFQNNVINASAAEWVMRDGGLLEPWVFLVGADGRIAARFDNVMNASELAPLLDALPVIGPRAT
ncbi:MAG: hypothetical protein ACT4OS_11265 [Acidimicrobiales bacterium]